jgi:lipoyl(octanoyl) transferase
MQPEAEWIITHPGLVDYRKAHHLQLCIVEARRKGILGNNLVLMLEHPPVLTIGRSSSCQHIIKDHTFLAAHGIDTISIERGGDVTFHGPGQLVVYVLIDLRSRGMDIREFVMSLEEVMIRAAKDEGIIATRDPRNIGVWVNGEKLGSIGIAIRHGITFHGFALNVNTDLTPFQWIHPCGLKDVSMTSLAVLKNTKVNMADVCQSVERHLQDVFHISLNPVPSQWLEQFSSI